MNEFNIPKKFSEKQIDEFATKVFDAVQHNKGRKFIFDLSNVQWIANQNLLFLSSLWKYFIETNIDFKVKLFKDNFSDINYKEALIILQLWEIWKIYQILPSNSSLKEYFDINTNHSIENLKKDHKIKLKNDFFDRYGITPLITLNKIENFSDFKLLKQEIEPIYLLNEVIYSILKDNDCEHPFLHNTLSAIITRELYENFLDHYQDNLFQGDQNWAFLSLSLKKQLINYDNDRLELNFKEEELPETINFFKNVNGKFKNQPLIQFSFIDYGRSIVDTIRDEYLNKNNLIDSFEHDPSEILKFAFKHNSSRHPISHKFSNIEKVIPRGLFDILSIVKRYNGLIIVRSGGGKIYYDFSDSEKNIDESVEVFGNKEDIFFGNFITIYIPPVYAFKEFNYSTIKPSYNIRKNFKSKESYLSLFELLDNITSKNFSKSEFYSKGIEELDKQLNRKRSDFIFFDFQGWEFDRRLSKIFIFYLTTTYDINYEKSITIINPPEKEFLANINVELADLLDNLVSFQTHPLPFIYFDSVDDSLSIYWTGIFQEEDNNTLNKILLEIPDLRKDDFLQPENVTGNVIFLDRFGNVKTNMPDQDRFLTFYKEAFIKLEDENIEMTMSNSINYGEKNCFYICSGNYYTEKYITFDKIILNDFRNRNFSRLLFNRIRRVVGNIDDYIFISVTSMNTKILKSMVDQNLVHKNRTIFLENYHYKLKEYKNQQPLEHNSKYILICELIATGSLTNKIYHELKTEYNSSLEFVGVYINTLGLGEMDLLVDDLKGKIIYLKRDEIDKHSIKKLGELEIKKDIVRINPFTNQPVHKSIKKTNISDSIILQTEDFFKELEENMLKIRYVDYYGSIQSYFFDLQEIILKKGNSLIERIFENIREEIKKDINIIFYPKNSAAAFIDFDYLTDKILLNHKIPHFELERFETSDGYKFPHLSSFYKDLCIQQKILIIDDSSNSGNSIQQLIDEIIFFDVKEIVVLVLLSRISDEKLEFLSRIKSLKGNKSQIKISILYGYHINIPTYDADKNPNNLEINWLKQIKTIYNAPTAIVNISEKILKEISTIPIDNYENDYKYLPWNGETKISKKTLAETRNEVGKILGHRFYRENFNYFNSLIIVEKDYSNPSYTKKIEELISVFLYEPFLYTPFKKILPDIVALIEGLIDYIIFPENEINYSKTLYYNWDRKDIVHLVFIVFNDKELFKKIGLLNNFKKIIQFSGNNRIMTLNYIFYKLLKYAPIEKSEITTKIFSGDIKHILDTAIQESSIDFSQIILREIKYFKSFLSTLPCDKKFKSLLSKVAGNYGKLKDDKEHSHAIKALYDKFRMKLKILKNKFYEELADELFYDWESISSFINDILQLHSTYPTFFIIHQDRIENKKQDSLKGLSLDIFENVKNISIETNISEIERKLEWFKKFFLDKNELKEEVEDRFYNIFTQITTPDIVSLIHSAISDHNLGCQNGLIQESDEILYKLNTNFNEMLIIDFPYVYFKSVILKELINNLEHRDVKQIVNFDLCLKEKVLSIKIENHKKQTVNKIGGNGIRMINKLNNYPNQFVSYKNNILEESNELFIQELTFEIT
ncbi:MAG: hypothetical protein R2797_05345 [Gelidibacter sp.]